MRQVIIFNMVTLDGFFDGPGRDIGWHNVDAEFNEFAIAQLDTVGGLLFGRVTYEGMASYWPTPVAIQNDPEVAGKMNRVPKYVFSKTLDKADWQNTTLIKGDAAGEVAKLKQQPGQDLFIFGSAEFAAHLLAMGLIDELRVMVNPILLGSGTPLFRGLHQRIPLKLLAAQPFRSGNVLLRYKLVD
jgi:dihydrofolate reductase